MTDPRWCSGCGKLTYISSAEFSTEEDYCVVVNTHCPACGRDEFFVAEAKT